MPRVKKPKPAAYVRISHEEWLDISIKASAYERFVEWLKTQRLVTVKPLTEKDGQ